MWNGWKTVGETLSGGRRRHDTVQIIDTADGNVFVNMNILLLAAIILSGDTSMCSDWKGLQWSTRRARRRAVD